MGWVVTGWRTDRLAELVGQDALDAARRIVAEAERDAGALRAAAAGQAEALRAEARVEAATVRAAARHEAADAAASLAAIERLGTELSGTVRAFRMGEPRPPRPAPLVPPEAAPVPAALVPPEAAPVAAHTPARPRRSRASLKDSSLADMMRASAAR